MRAPTSIGRGIPAHQADGVSARLKAAGRAADGRGTGWGAGGDVVVAGKAELLLRRV